MSGEIFCCSSATPYRSIRTDHDPKFTAFLTATTQSSIDALQDNATASDVQLSDKAFAVQVVRQINFGPVEWKRYFAPNQGQGDVGGFQEVTEKALVDANFSKLNSFKNFKCTVHNRFFELNLYKKDPVNKHHWRADVARPAGEIDI
ncbi:hypothetical protein FRB94_005899 [Tulasnella sp. JGI-2019a]|nr:hypothetical protein FRB93_009037 [Tulasnella sp. JGI-2019a]KAG8983257.1 hypothetical protein FRB94_005899 [Tulasnella sp. JGI-2019a]